MPLGDLLRVDSTVIDEVKVATDRLEIRVFLLIVLRRLEVGLRCTWQSVRVCPQAVLVAALDYDVVSGRGWVVLAGGESDEPLGFVRIVPGSVCFNGNDQVSDDELV